MAKDIKGMNQVIHHADGYISGPRGLMEYFFDYPPSVSAVAVRTDKRGRKRLVNTTRRTAGKAGRSAYLELSDGRKYQVRYGGPYWALVTQCAAHGKAGLFVGISTESGTRASRRLS